MSFAVGLRRLPEGGRRQYRRPCRVRRCPRRVRASFGYGRVLSKPCGPSQQHRLSADVVIDPRLEATVVDEVDLTAENLLDELLESEEPERRCSLRCLDDEVDVGIWTGPLACNGSEDR